MAGLGANVKNALFKGLETIGKAASTLSDAAQQKLNEMNLDTRRRELLAEIPKCVMQLWKDGTELPEPLSDLLTELTALEEKLAVLRPQPAAEKNTQDEKDATEAEEENPDTEHPEEAPVQADSTEECQPCECSAEDCCTENAKEQAEEND